LGYAKESPIAGPFEAGRGWASALGCPIGYILVPKKTGYTSANFCVAKYEAKRSGSIAVSQAGGTPWGSLTVDQAVLACQANGVNYDLIINAEWQTLAQNIQLVAANWSGGAVNNGSINRGHSDNEPANALVADQSDSNACANTGQTCSNSTWSDQRRTHLLSNGEVIWDLAGNVWEWVKDPNYEVSGNDDYISQITDTSHPDTFNIGSITGTIKFLFGPVGYFDDIDEFISGEYGGFGKAWLEYIGGTIARGSYWNPAEPSGIFTVRLDLGNSNRFPGIGFRCVYHF